MELLKFELKGYVWFNWSGHFKCPYEHNLGLNSLVTVSVILYFKPFSVNRLITQISDTRRQVQEPDSPSDSHKSKFWTFDLKMDDRKINDLAMVRRSKTSCRLANAFQKWCFHPLCSNAIVNSHIWRLTLKTEFVYDFTDVWWHNVPCRRVN